MSPATVNFNDRKCWRIIPSRFPPINLFERVAHPSDLEAVIALESMTNDRLRDEVGDISLIAPQDRICGPGSGYIMAAFTHVNPMGSRFSDGSYGVYYAAFDLETAIAETKYHRTLFMQATQEEPTKIDMRVLIAKVKGEFYDLMQQVEPNIYDLKEYKAAQELAGKLRATNSDGIAYTSVRKSSGTNIAVFKPKALSSCAQERHLEYVWDGNSIVAIFEKKMMA